MSAGSLVLKGVTALVGITAVLFVAATPHHGVHVEKESWSFQGFFGKFDKAQLQRGFQVYNEVCAACHSLDLVHYRNLTEIGLTEAQVKEVAAAVTVVDAMPDENGDPVERPGLPSDPFKAPFANEQAARASNNGALPPDLSLIARSRAGAGFGAHEGADYLHGLLTGYQEPPAGFELADGMQYNEGFLGFQIAMPNPLSDGGVTYADGTEATVDQQARDVSAFLTWAGEPNYENRIYTGMKAMLFLIVFTLIAYAVKRRVWAKIH
ncbi:ubiquinol-cytochrome c reductase cytochrome c1 subunit [Dongia mobilis]|uniref:Cytochrome c1 n=1 Tax=Dongia mobilis TaxID=578943 RepID=A0A4R6WZA8_9PROT|nr:cytochrome c1 [Dongia mobilis]TDQ86387.1 ubiquinol-cytochrome c reductase cytochrome c1 subunit [Dongia mobilis]